MVWFGSLFQIFQSQICWAMVGSRWKGLDDQSCSLHGNQEAAGARGWGGAQGTSFKATPPTTHFLQSGSTFHTFCHLPKMPSNNESIMDWSIDLAKVPHDPITYQWLDSPLGDHAFNTRAFWGHILSKPQQLGVWCVHLHERHCQIIWKDGLTFLCYFHMENIINISISELNIPPRTPSVPSLSMIKPSTALPSETARLSCYQSQIQLLF